MLFGWPFVRGGKKKNSFFLFFFFLVEFFFLTVFQRILRDFYRRSSLLESFQKKNKQKKNKEFKNYIEHLLFFYTFFFYFIYLFREERSMLEIATEKWNKQKKMNKNKKKGVGRCEPNETR